MEVVHRLAQNSRLKRSLKGDDGPEGQRGEQGEGDDGATGPRGRDGKHGKKGDQGPEGQDGADGKDADPSEVAHRLAHNSRFKRSLKGDDGPEGPEGKQGDKGDDGATGPRGRDGKHGKKGDQCPEGQRGEQGDKGEDGTKGLRGRDGKHGKRGDNDVESLLKNLMENDVDIFSPDARSKRSAAEFQQKLQLRVTQGESYDQDKNEANIELEMEGKSVVIATFLEIGYFFKNDDLYIRNHITGENILIPKNFHFLKVIEDGLDNYKLAFCNNLGNLFFDHKKYDPEYADLSEEHKLIDLKYIKNAANIDLSKYYYHTHTPLFAVKQGELEGQSLEDYRADVYEIAKDKKIGTLVDEFGFFEDGKFHHIDHHYGSDEHSEELDVRIQDYEGNFQIGGNIVHPITLYDGHLDLTDYLGYSVNL